MDKMYYTNSDIFLLYFPFNTLVKIQRYICSFDYDFDFTKMDYK